MPVETLDELHLWNGQASADAARTWTEHHLAESRAQVQQLLAVETARTVENTLAPYAAIVCQPRACTAAPSTFALTGTF